MRVDWAFGSPLDEGQKQQHLVFVWHPLCWIVFRSSVQWLRVRWRWLLARSKKYVFKPEETKSACIPGSFPQFDCLLLQGRKERSLCWVGHWTALDALLSIVRLLVYPHPFSGIPPDSLFQGPTSRSIAEHAFGHLSLPHRLSPQPLAWMPRWVLCFVLLMFLKYIIDIAFNPHFDVPFNNFLLKKNLVWRFIVNVTLPQHCLMEIYHPKA